MGEATTDPVRLPPGPRIPKAVMGIAFLTARHRAVAAMGRRYGSAFTREPADLRRDHRHQRPGVDQGPLHHEQ